jgi:hypothetical protein
MQTLLAGRSRERAGDTCTVNEDCTAFSCSGVVDPTTNPPVTASSTYTFLPCEDPIGLTILSEVSSIPFPVIDTTINQSTVIVLNPDFLGNVEAMLEPTMSGVTFEVRVFNQPSFLVEC